MKYVKPEIEVIAVDKDVFMTPSPNHTYSSAEEALASECGGFSGATNNFSCQIFGGYGPANPPTQNAQVIVGDGVYVFDYKGNHWKLHKGNN